MPITFKDIINSNFVDSFKAIPAFDMFLSLLIAFVLGLFIHFVYRKTYAGVMYSKTFGITLISLTMITAMLILAVTSNVILSLGMVGALSIVRFRTAIKEPSDIIYLFWGISVGIIVAAGFYPLAILGSAFIGIMLLVSNNMAMHEQPYILVIHACDISLEENLTEKLKTNTKKFSLKSKTISRETLELHYEIRLKEESTKFISEISEIEGVQSAILVSYNGDYMS